MGDAAPRQQAGIRSTSPLSGRELSEIARECVLRVESRLGDRTISHGSAFVYKQTYGRSDDKSSTLAIATNLHNFTKPLVIYRELVRQARRGAHANELTLSHHIVGEDWEAPITRIIAAKDAFESQNYAYADDFAIIQCEFNLDRKIKLFATPRDSDAVQGDQGWAFGFPKDTELTASSGVFSHIYGDDPKERVFRWQIQHTININPGNSGGPTVNPFGVSVGISTWAYHNYDGLNFSVNLHHIFDRCKDLRSTEVIDVEKVAKRLAARAVEEARFGH